MFMCDVRRLLQIQQYRNNYEIKYMFLFFVYPAIYLFLIWFALEWFA